MSKVCTKNALKWYNFNVICLAGSGDETVTCNGVPGKEDFVYDIYCLKDQPSPKSGGSDTFSFSDQDWKDVKTYFDELEDEVYSLICSFDEGL